MKNGIFDYFSNEMQLFFTNNFVFLSKKEKNQKRGKDKNHPWTLDETRPNIVYFS